MKAGAAKAAADERRGEAAPIRAWLRETCEIDDEKELTAILDLFVDPRYGAKSLKRLFALEETDIDTILRQATVSVTTLRLVKKTWCEQRPSAKEATAEKAERRDLHTFTAVKVAAFVVLLLMLVGR